MRKLLTVVALLLTTSLFAQERMGVGLEAGVTAPYGVRLSGAVRFSSLISLRAGATFLPSIPLGDRQLAKVDDPMIERYLGVSPSIQAEAQLQSVHGQLLVDLHPFRSGFRVTAGVYAGTLKLGASGRLVDPETHQPIPALTANYDLLMREGYLPLDAQSGVEGVVSLKVLPDPEGTVKASAQVGNVVKPYLGIGYGYAVPSGRVSFMADLGVLYSGPVKFSSDNVVRQEGGKWVPDDLDAIAHRVAEVQKYEPYVRFVPVLGLGLSVRLF